MTFTTNNIISIIITTKKLQIFQKKKENCKKYLQVSDGLSADKIFWRTDRAPICAL